MFWTIFCLFSCFSYTQSMIKTETTEAKSSALSGTSSTKEASKYTDYSLITGLSGRRHKKDFVSWVDQEFEVTATDTPDNRVSYIAQMMRREEGSKPSFIHDLEASLISVLARMEYRGVAFDQDRLVDIGERIRADIARLETEIHELV